MGGPSRRAEPAPKTSKYPKPKKNEKVKCLGCTNGLVLGVNGKAKTCRGCDGEGFIVAK